jgi:hypothetical protein
MASMDIFRSKAFSLIEMTDAINRVPYKPMAISRLNLFTVRRVRTQFVAIEEKAGRLSVIQTSPRGEPINRDRNATKRDLRNFNTARLADAATINAAEIEGIRAFGTESEFVQVQKEVADRLAGPDGLVGNFELTWERQRLGAIQGIVLDADGTELYNWFDEWGITQATEIDFDLDAAAPASGALRKKCNQVIRQAKVASQGAWVEGSTSLVALCGDNFFDDLTTHKEVRETYLNQIAAAELRTMAQPYESFTFGGITWVNYRGTDDGTTVGVNTDKVVFFPVGAPGAFIAAFSPGEFFGTVNQPGRDLYSRIVIDPDAGGNMDQAAWVKAELYSYPLFICTVPGMLQRGRRT